MKYIDDAELRMWRARERISQTAAAALFKVPRATYARWEAGFFPRDLSQKWFALFGNGERPARPQAPSLALLPGESFETAKVRIDEAQAEYRRALADYELAYGRDA